MLFTSGNETQLKDQAKIITSHLAGGGDPRKVYAIAADPIPSHSHSVIFGYGNALIFQREVFIAPQNTLRLIRQKFTLLNSKRNFGDPRFARFHGRSAAIGQFSRIRRAHRGSRQRTKTVRIATVRAEE